LLGKIGGTRVYLGQHDEAEDDLEEAVKKLSKIDRKKDLANALNDLGSLFAIQNHPTAAKTVSTERSILLVLIMIFSGNTLLLSISVKWNSMKGRPIARSCATKKRIGGWSEGGLWTEARAMAYIESHILSAIPAETADDESKCSPLRPNGAERRARRNRNQYEP
jgi:hypothetical protein